MYYIETHSKTWPTSLLYIQLRSIQNPVKMQLFVKIVNNFQSLTIFTTSSILDFRFSEYVSVQ